MRAGLIVLAMIGLLAGLFGAPGAGAGAQQLGVVQSDVLVIDIERLLAETAYGKRLQAEIEAARDQLIARNERIAAGLEAEERDLTDKRATTPPETFRDMADDFDAKVTELRSESEQLARELERRRELAPIQFMRVVQPVLSEVLQEANAVVLMDVRSVLLSADVADVTNLAIARIDAWIGEGPKGLPPLLELDTRPAAPPAPQE